MPTQMKKIQNLTPIAEKGLKKEFIEYANLEINKINQLIEKYNSTTDERKLRILYRIDFLRKALEDRYPQDIFVNEFTIEIQNKLFEECRKQYAEFNISMHEHALAKNHPKHPDASLPEQNSPFSEMLANMPTENVREMLNVLAYGSKYSQSSFFNLFKNSHPEYNKIINLYKIEFLGGGNSKNFKLTFRDETNPHSFVLRVDDRLGGAREMDTHLRSTALASLLTPIEGVRSATYHFNGKLRTNTLLITSVCPNGTPLAHSRRMSSLENTIQGALDIYTQMGNALANLEKEGCLFPDAKNSNWLLDKDGKLVIADTKSLLFSHKGNYDAYNGFDKNRWIYGSIPGLVTTQDYKPRELNDKKFNVDKMHSFIMGINLYQYLTLCKDYELKYTLNFDLPIFKNTSAGKQLKTLITQMTHPDPNMRIGVTEALSQLQAIKNLTLVQEKTSIPSPVAITIPKKEPSIEESFVKNIVTKLRSTGITQASAMRKADAIEKAFEKIPENQRKEIMTSNNPSPEIIAFRKELGAYRTYLGNIHIPDSLVSFNPIFNKYKQEFQTFKNQQILKEPELQNEHNPPEMHKKGHP